jgi:hypothetical protein
MSCWCGHGSWHHYGYAYPPPMYPSAPYPRPGDEREGARRRPDEELERRLAHLEEELARVRQELAEQRSS